MPKNRSLTLRATTNLPSGHYQPYWKVRNGGDEADKADELRGEVSRDLGNATKIETTLYKGTHYVECYAVADGAVVARDRQVVIIT